jgi:2-polyprenyl-3-methyl-5-hydroxy-6-metoxy-1,4-benzoquinol methylase
MGEKDINRRTGDKIAIDGDYQYNAFYNGSALQRSWHRFKIGAALQNLDLKPGKQILDAGCGSGILPALVARDHPSIRVTGIDENADAIEFCKQQWKDLPNACFEEARIDRINQLQDASLDGIAFLEVIEHITEQQAFDVLADFYRLLKKGGILVMSTPNRKSLWPLLEIIMDSFRLAPKMGSDQHEQLYSGSELIAIAEQSGFLTVKKQRINFIAPWLAFFSEKFAARIHRWELRQNRLPGSLLLYTFVKK